MDSNALNLWHGREFPNWSTGDLGQGMSAELSGLSPTFLLGRWTASPKHCFDILGIQFRQRELENHPLAFPCFSWRFKYRFIWGWESGHMNSCESRRQKNLAERIHFVASSVSPSISPLAARMFYLEWTGFSSDRGEDGHSLATTEHFLASNFKADCCCCCSSDVSQLLSNLQHDPQETEK